MWKSTSKTSEGLLEVCRQQICTSDMSLLHPENNPTDYLSQIQFLISIREWSIFYIPWFLSHSRRAHQWKDCRLPVLSPHIPLKLWPPHKARKAPRLCQPYWRWSRTRSESLMGLQTNMCALEFWISVLTTFCLLHVRTLDEQQQQQQQQQVKPSTAVSDLSNVATAPTYVDSPRKVSVCSLCVYQNYFLLQQFSFCRHIWMYFLSAVNAWFIFVGASVSGFCFSPSICFVLHASVLFLLLSFGCLILGYVPPVCWQDAAFILDFIRSPRSSYIYHSQVSN